MAHEAHEEFPPLTQDAEAVMKAAVSTYPPGFVSIGGDPEARVRRLAAAALREGMRQVEPDSTTERQWRHWLRLEAIADNLHSPPSPPPSMAALRQAVQELEDWDGGMEIRTGDWLRERIGIVKRGIDHHLKG